jgi:hypothetical protein
MVAGESGQEMSMKTKKSSPTMSTEVLFLSAAVDAYKSRKVIAVEIGGASLHAEMSSNVIMQICKEAASMLLQMYPDECTSYVDNRDLLYVKLDGLFMMAALNLPSYCSASIYLQHY